MKRSKLYCCRRLRMLKFLVDRGFKVVETLPDTSNPKYKVWMFEWTDDFNTMMEYYFNEYLLKD